jgi:hypothetical protein
VMPMAPRPRPEPVAEPMPMAEGSDDLDAVIAAAQPLTFGGSASIPHGPDEIVGVTFEAPAGEWVLISVVSLTQGDPVVGLFSPSGELLATDEEGGEGLNAIVSFQGLPETGTYLAAAIDATGLPGEVDFFIDSGVVAFELLDETNRVVDSALHSSQLVVDTRLLIRVTSDVPVIVGVARGDEVLAADEITTGGSIDLTFDVPATGDYAIIVLGPEGQEFEYTITVTEVQFGP